MCRGDRWLSRVGVVAALLVGLCEISPASKSSQAPLPGRETSVALPGVRIWYRDTGGSGVPVVFVHAATGSSQVWEHQLPAFTAAGYRIVTYDRRGFGRSVIDPSGLQPGSGADDLLALIDRLGMGRFHLIGTAAGGGIALDFALSFPQRLQPRGR